MNDVQREITLGILAFADVSSNESAPQSLSTVRSTLRPTLDPATDRNPAVRLARAKAKEQRGHENDSRGLGQNRAGIPLHKASTAKAPYIICLY